MDYDNVAADYDRRYDLHDYAGIRRALFDAAAQTEPAPMRVLELGCGTGKWLLELERNGFQVAGIDPSPEMLKRASVNGDVRLGYAEQLPWHDGTFDLVICVNALHHFRSPREAIAQAHRVLRPGGGFVSIGLDPGAFAGTWYVYEFFPTTLRRDLERFPTREQRLGWLEESGFERINVSVAERIRSTATFQSALAQGILARSFTSQLTHLTDTEYSEGIARIRAAAHRDESFRLVADLELHSTSAWRPVRAPEPCELGRQVPAERSGPTGR